MKTTLKSVALFAVVLGVSAIVLVGTASAAGHGSSGKMGSSHMGQSNHMQHRDKGDRSHEDRRFDHRRYDWDRYCRYGYGSYPYFSSCWYPCYEPRYCMPEIVYVPQYIVPQPVVEECQPACPAPVCPQPICAEPACPEPCYSECPPCFPSYAGCSDDYRYDRHWKDHDKWKDRDSKPGKGGPSQIHPLTESQHASTSSNLGKAPMKVAGNFRGSRR